MAAPGNYHDAYQAEKEEYLEEPFHAVKRSFLLSFAFSAMSTG